MEAIGDLGSHQLLFLALGAAFLLLGWLLYWVSIQVSGALLVGGSGLLLGGALARTLDLGEPMALALAGGCALVGAILGMLVARFLHLAGFFVLGGIVGASIFHAVVTNWRGGGAAPHEFLASDLFLSFGIPTAAALGGILAVLLSDVLIVWCGAGLGAALIMQALGWPLGGIPLVPLLIAGAVMQLALTKGMRSRKRAAGGE